MDQSTLSSSPSQSASNATPTLLTSPALAQIEGLVHGFTTRHGGVSFGQNALNLSYRGDDTPDNVAENRQRVTQALGEGPILSVHQVHGTRIMQAQSLPETVWSAPYDVQALPEADGLWSDTAGHCLGVMAADCCPVLIADRRNARIGAAHAGWKGAIGGVLENLVAALVQAGSQAQDLVAALGPTIAWDSYEVGPDFPAPILAQSSANARFFKPSPDRKGHHLFDLPGYIESQLSALGLGQVDNLDQDTLTQADRFFSYRHARQNGLPDFGRMMGVIALTSASDQA